ncbi:Spn1 transposase [Streptococcus pneumoniae]|nr:Spn1 transposase [Streptococcus pneumoniae]
MEQLHFITKLLDIKDPNIQILDIINKDTHKEIIAKLDYDAPSCPECGNQLKKYDFQKPGWLKLKEKTGELNHQVKGTKPRKVDRDRLKNYLTDNPDAYLTEIASEFGCHPTTIHYALKAMGYTRKKEPHLL